MGARRCKASRCKAPRLKQSLTSPLLPDLERSLKLKPIAIEPITLIPAQATGEAAIGEVNNLSLGTFLRQEGSHRI